MNYFIHMKRTILYLVIAVFLNALGTAIMEQTRFGMTAWGSVALNTSNYFGVSLGTGFIFVSVFFYTIAILLRKKLSIVSLLQSLVFLFSFSYLADIFIYVIPDLSVYSYIFRLWMNFIGLCILLFGIAVHLKIHIAIHPMDVYLHVVQSKLNSITYGTYIAYFSGFVLAIVFGSLYGSIEGIGIGTLLTLTLSGLILNLYDVYILKHFIKSQTR